jgi:hypothetical protein
MPAPAQVTSIEAIESFRASLIVYLGKARTALDEIGAEVLRTRFWLENEQSQKWEQELRIRLRRLEEAKQELFTARLSPLEEANALQYMAVQKAERAVKEAEAKLAVLKRWNREMQNRTDPLTKQAEQLHGYLTGDMAKAVLHLTQVVKALEAYATVEAPPASAPAAAPEGKDPAA